MPVAFVSRPQVPAYLVTGTLFTSPVNTKLPESRTVDNYVFQDNGTWVKGKHTVSFGFQANLFRYGIQDYASTAPSYAVGISAANLNGFKVGDIPGATSTDITRANNLLATLGGMIMSSTQTFNVTNRTSGFVPGAPQVLNLRLSNYAPYITDTWKVARRLTPDSGSPLGVLQPG